MAGLLNSFASIPIKPTYKDQRANTFYGQGNKSISDDDIRAFINTPGRTDAEIEGEALRRNISAKQVSRAMAGNPRFSESNIDRHLAEQGVSKEKVDYTVPQVALPSSVTPNTIKVGNNETVEGRMQGILQNPNNPLNVQAATYGKEFANNRGLLNSSIAASATQDALYKNAQPIASQDASTFYDANKTNVGNKLTADMFNNDLSSRVGMFNAGTQKDIAINTQNRDMDFAIANLDSDNKMAIARVQAAANESGIMGELGKTLMAQYTNVLGMNLSPELRDQAFGVLNRQFEQMTGLMSSFENAGKKISFNSASSTGGTSFSETPAGGSGLLTNGDGVKTNSSPSSSVKKINTLGLQIEPSTLAAVGAYERQTGNTVDRSKVAPQQLVEDMRYGSLWYTMNDGFYIGNDGLTKRANYTSYDYKKLMQETGAKNQGELFGKLFIPIHGPRSMRADNPLFYVWNEDTLRALK